MNIVICICTYQRPDGLRKLLESLPTLVRHDSLSVVVVDNHEKGAGLQVCKQMQSSYEFELKAYLEPGDGISAARNAAVSNALSQNPDWVAFLDDDEWPEPQWLSELLRIQQMHNADLVGGPTRPVFPEGTDPDLLDNPYYGADLALPDGSACQLEAGGNFLIRASVLREFAPVVFHPSFAHSGGEDLAFFTQVNNRGHSMHWAANAVVHEPVPAARLQADWLKQRVITIHNSRVRVMQMLQPGFVARSIRVLKTIALGSVVACFSAVASILPAYRQAARMLRWKFCGKLTAHLGSASMRGENQ